MTKSRVGGWMSTALTIASGSSAAAEFDVRGFIPMVFHVKGPWTAANMGFKARADNQSTARVVYDNVGSPLQISGINTTVGGSFAAPSSPGLAGITHLVVYKKSTTTATTSAVNQTGGATTVYIEGIG